MHETLLRDLALVMIVAGVVTVVFHMLRQPVVLGYMLAGLLVSPHTKWFPTVAHEEAVSVLSELGVILLLFSLGIHFSFRRLFSVGATALVAAIFEIVLMGWLGYEIGKAFGWKSMDSLFLGAVLSVSSTTIIVKALADLHLSRQLFADLIFGILIVEDILAIAIIALLSGVATTGELQVRDVAATMSQLTLFFISVVVVGLLVVPWFMDFIARFRSREMMLVASLGLCFGVSLLAHNMGYSVALGAFLIGAVIADSRQHKQIEELVEPVRDMFSAIFFVAVGMMINPSMLLEYTVPILIITIVVIVGKIIACSLGTFITGHDGRTSLRVGMGVSQIGEFSFIIAQLGVAHRVTSDFLYPIVVTVSVITTLTTPYLIKYSDTFVVGIEKITPQPVRAQFELYSRWIGRFRGGSQLDPIRKTVRRTLIQIAVNLTLVTCLFVISRYSVGWLVSHVETLREHETGTKTAVWVIAMLFAMPLLIATFRKFRAMAMLIAEISVTRAAAGEHTAVIRAVITNVLVVAATLGLVLLLIALSAAILPPWPVMIVLALGLSGLVVLMWRQFVKLYAKAQVALQATLEEKPSSGEPASGRE
ncbi:MAG: cation:proton antiporter [Phycisphaeraceae bacterium]|nr:cation:proton antiporter [Phycisphaeraceae bacterium]